MVTWVNNELPKSDRAKSLAEELAQAFRENGGDHLVQGKKKIDRKVRYLRDKTKNGSVHIIADEPLPTRDELLP